MKLSFIYDNIFWKVESVEQWYGQSILAISFVSSLNRSPGRTMHEVCFDFTPQMVTLISIIASYLPAISPVHPSSQSQCVIYDSLRLISRAHTSDNQTTCNDHPACSARLSRSLFASTRYDYLCGRAPDVLHPWITHTTTRRKYPTPSAIHGNIQQEKNARSIDTQQPSWSQGDVQLPAPICKYIPTPDSIGSVPLQPKWSQPARARSSWWTNIGSSEAATTA